VVTGRLHSWRGNVLLASVALILTTIGAELAMRRLVPWLMPRASEAAGAGERPSWFRRHGDDRGLLVAPVLDLEETCSAVHGRPIYRAAAFIERIRRLAIRVLDANPVMADAHSPGALPP
jgi:hypothetical protein